MLMTPSDSMWNSVHLTSGLATFLMLKIVNSIWAASDVLTKVSNINDRIWVMDGLILSRAACDTRCTVSGRGNAGQLAC